MLPASRTLGGHRRSVHDALEALQQTRVYNPQPVTKTCSASVYARVSGVKQKEDFARQVAFLREKALQDGLSPKVYADIGSGLNDERPNMLRLLRDGLTHRFDRVYLTYMDRLARFGTRPILELFKF
jgi:putative resolvase